MERWTSGGQNKTEVIKFSVDFPPKFKMLPNSSASFWGWQTDTATTVYGEKIISFVIVDF